MKTGDFLVKITITKWVNNARCLFADVGLCSPTYRAVVANGVNMKFGCTCITSEEVGDFFNSVSLSIASDMNKKGPPPSFGDAIDHFAVGIIAVDAGELNERFMKKCDRIGWYKDIRTKARVNSLDIGIPFNPDEIVGMTVDAMKALVIKKLFEKLDNLDIKVPKNFDYAGMVAYLKGVLSPPQ